MLPSKDQSDILVAKYFDVVDPVYPMIHRESFQKDYDDFWSLQSEDHRHADGSLVALVFVMLAMGMQFVALSSPDVKEQTAEFYVSASHQALRVINYLGRPSLRSMQCMVLVIYFLMNDNHASDAWAFAGILTRHAYALGLNRDPSVTAPNSSPFEKQQRRKLWQAVRLSPEPIIIHLGSIQERVIAERFIPALCRWLSHAFRAFPWVSFDKYQIEKC